MTSSEEVNITTMLTQLIPMQTDVEVFLLALNIFLAITASLGNALILNALPKVTSLHSPTKLLFGNLAVTDLCVGLISQPLFVTIRLSTFIKMNTDIQYYLRNIATAIDFILCAVSILTLSAISVDRLLALLLGTRYRTIVNLRHTRALLSFFWLTGIAAVLLRVFTSFSVAAIVGVIFLIIVIVISVFCYTKIFMTLRQFETQVQNRGQQRREGMPPNIGRYKKNSLEHCVGAVAINRMLYSFYYLCYSDNDKGFEWYDSEHYLDIYIQSDLRKFFIEPNSLLLADQRRETRSEGHDQTVLLPLKLG